MATLLRGFQIANNQVGASHLQANSVTSAKIVDANVTTAKIADANVTTAKLADSSVTSDKINDGAIGAVKLAADAVETAKIKDLAVTSAKLADGAVLAAKIGTGAVETAKLAASAVTAAKLADDAVTTSKILDANVTEAKLANASVTSDKLGADSVDGSKIADDAIGSEHIADGAVLTAAIADGAITYAKLDATVQAKLDNTLSRIVDATTDPTANDDSANTSGASWSYGTAAQIGSIWINTTSDEIFRCMDDSVGAAVWTKTSLNVSELGDLAEMDLATLQTTIQISGISQVTGLESALDAKADDSDVVKLTGNQTIAGTKTFSSAIVGDLTGDVTGTVSDLSNHLGTLAGAAEDKYVDAAELASKFSSIQGDIDTKADDSAVVHLSGAETVTGAKTFSAAVSMTLGFEIGVNSISSIQTTLRADGSAEDSAIISEAGVRTALDSLQTTLQNAINLKANDSAVVHLTGAETIAGVKTFNDAAVFSSGFSIAGSSISSVQSTVRTSGNTSSTAVVTETAVRSAIDAATAQVALSVRKEFTGDGTTNSFTFDQDGGTTSQLLVYRNGQLLRSTDDYTSNGSSVAFGSAPESGEYIDILRWYTGN